MEESKPEFEQIHNGMRSETEMTSNGYAMFPRDNQQKQFQPEEINMICHRYVENHQGYLLDRNAPGLISKRQLIENMVVECNNMGYGVRTYKQVEQRLRDEFKKLKKFIHAYNSVRPNASGVRPYPKASPGTIFLFEKLHSQQQETGIIDDFDIISRSPSVEPRLHDNDGTSNQLQYNYMVEPVVYHQPPQQYVNQDGGVVKKRKYDSPEKMVDNSEVASLQRIHLIEKIELAKTKKKYYKKLIEKEDLKIKRWKAKVKNGKANGESSESSSDDSDID